jgi:haloacetate dehalogenase
MRDPGTVHAMCEDYRANATIDLEHDTADLGRKIACPMMVLWGEKGGLPRCQSNCRPRRWRSSRRS